MTWTQPSDIVQRLRDRWLKGGDLAAQVTDREVATDRPHDQGPVGHRAGPTTSPRCRTGRRRGTAQDAAAGRVGGWSAAGRSGTNSVPGRAWVDTTGDSCGGCSASTPRLRSVRSTSSSGPAERRRRCSAGWPTHPHEVLSTSRRSGTGWSTPVTWIDAGLRAYLGGLPAAGRRARGGHQVHGAAPCRCWPTLLDMRSSTCRSDRRAQSRGRNDLAEPVRISDASPDTSGPVSRPGAVAGRVHRD